MENPFEILVEVTRGPLVESVHFGALAIVDSHGNLFASRGNPDLVANLRSSAKPFQALPMVERGGPEVFGMTEREIAITCASHMGTDDHVAVLRGLQAKIGIRENDLRCGVHPAAHEPTARRMLLHGEEPTPNRHNCSGKHTGMLAHAVMRQLPIENYLDNQHEIQKTILQTFAEILGLTPSQVLVGIDGCSAPTFAAPLRAAALGYARLADPSQLESKRAVAIKRIFHAMTTNPDMVSGPGGFDTVLMEVGEGKILSKGGAEGYQAMALLPGAIRPGSPALGITIKIADGDAPGRARTLAAVEVLRQLGALNAEQLARLAEFDARKLLNWRQLEVGIIRPKFQLEPAASK